MTDKRLFGDAKSQAAKRQPGRWINELDRTRQAGPFLDAHPMDGMGMSTKAVHAGTHDAIIPSLSGRGWISGISQHLLDPSDPFPTGFTVGDIWA